MDSLKRARVLRRLLVVPAAWIAIAATPSAQTWPMADGTHDVLHSYQNPFFFSQYFHEGVDLRGSLADVRAVRSGTVEYVQQGDSGGTLVVKVPVASAPSGFEADSYLHIFIEPWNVGDPISAGDIVGQIRDNYFSQLLQDHVHVNRFDGYAGGSGYVTGRTNMLHPLNLFTSPAERDPQQLDPDPDDADEDGGTFRVVDAFSNGLDYPFAFGAVDLVLEATDRQSSTLYWNQGLVSAGYWIDSFAAGDDVRSAATPYKLVEFADDWRSSHANCDNLVSQVLRANSPSTVEFGPDNTGWSMLANYVLTNTTGTVGSGSEVDADEHWRTDARVGSGSEPNGSDAAPADEIHEARFPDGHYVVHGLTTDLEHEVDTAYSVVVDNFRPYVERLRATDVASGTVLYDGSWSYDSGTQQLTFQNAASPSGPAPGTSGVALQVTFSEAMQGAVVRATAPPLPMLPPLTSSEPVNEQRTWEGTLAPPLPLGSLQLFFSGFDLNGTTLHPFASTASVVAPFNKRTSVAPINNSTVDSAHTIVLTDGPQVLPYGCGMNPMGSLTVLSGAPQLGTTITFGIDNPVGTQAAGSLPFLYFSFAPSILSPCGPSLPGLGMSAPGAAGELLIDVGAPNLALTLPGPPWTGPGTPSAVSVPISSNLALVATPVFLQGVLIDPSGGATNPIGLTTGAELRFGL